MHLGVLRTRRHVEQEPLARVARTSRPGQFSERALLLEQPPAREFLRVVEHQRHVVARAHGERLVAFDVHQEVGGAARIHAVGKPAEPAEGVAAVRRAGVPIRHRGEVGKARMVVADAVHDREMPVLVQPLEAGQGRLQAKMLVKLA